MSIAFTGLLICTVLAGCAGPLLNEYTDYLGPGVGTVEEKQILENLARFVDNPWAIPGHVELASGTIQVTNQVGLVGRWTNSHGFTGANATQSVGSEFDITPAQTQDQESYNTLPVTDSDDLRRLRALYNLAVCGNRRVFAKEWDIADQKIFQPALPPTPTKTSTPPITVHPSTVKEAVSHILDEYYKDTSPNPAKDALTSLEVAINGLISDEDKKQAIAAILSKYPKTSPSDKDKLENEILATLGDKATLNSTYTYAAGAAKATTGKSESTKSTTGSPSGDTVSFENKRKLFIDSNEGLGDSRWLFWTGASHLDESKCLTMILPPDTGGLTYLGSARGHNFWTSNTKKFSDLVLFVLGGIPNTVGIHILAEGTDGGPSVPPKSSTTQVLTGPGGSLTLIPQKNR